MKKRSLTRVAGGVAGILLWLAVWEWFTNSGPLASTAGMPQAFASLREGASLFTDASFWADVGVTLWMALIGLVIATVVGLTIGVVTGLSRFSSAALGRV